MSIVVDPKLKSPLIFKSYLYVAIVTNNEGAFLLMSIDCVYTEDVRAYIHVNTKYVSHSKFYDSWDKLTKSNLVTFKDKYKNISTWVKYLEIIP